jgi:hypothetical protein
MAKTYAIEPTITPGDFMVMEYDDENTDLATIVYDGTQAECERYVRDHERAEDDLCAHCGEAIERRDDEIVTKYGNDPQCDESPNCNHRFR